MEKADLVSHAGANALLRGGMFERALLEGIYTFECVRPKRGRDGTYEPLFKRDSELKNRIAAGEKLTADELNEFLQITTEMGQLSELAWGDTAYNTVMTVGKNLALDTFLAGSSYTVVGPFLGMISSVGYGAGPVIGDTMASHSGWNEAGGATNLPQWTTPASGARHTTNGGWAAAATGAKALSATKDFSISSSGTVKGAFLVYGTGAVATLADTNGTLMSAGLFSAPGDRVVANLDIVKVQYSLAF